MGPRGICWDDLPNRFYGKTTVKPSVSAVQSEVALEPAKHEFDLLKDGEAIGRRVMFGVLCGGITGAAFGFFDVMRDPKMFAAKRKEGTDKIMRFTVRFAGFFGCYHGLRKLLRVTVPGSSGEENVAVAGLLTITPMIVMRSFRPMVPYGVMMIALDAFNGLNDV